MPSITSFLKKEMRKLLGVFLGASFCVEKSVSNMTSLNDVTGILNKLCYLQMIFLFEINKQEMKLLNENLFSFFS